MTAPYFETGRSSYNMLKFGDYKEEKWIAQWLNRCVSFKSLLAVEPAVLIPTHVVKPQRVCATRARRRP